MSLQVFRAHTGDLNTFHWSCFSPSRTEQLHLLLSTLGIKDLLYFQYQLKFKAEAGVNVGVQGRVQVPTGGQSNHPGLRESCPNPAQIWLRGWSPSSPAQWIKNKHRFLLQERDPCQHSSKLTPDSTSILEIVTLAFPNRSNKLSGIRSLFSMQRHLQEHLTNPAAQRTQNMLPSIPTPSKARKSRALSL